MEGENLLLNKDFVYFGSDAAKPYCLLSNFRMCTIRLTPAQASLPVFLNVQPHLMDFVGSETREFPSTEHLWQSLKALDQAAFLAFTSEGRFGRWDPNVFSVTVAKYKGSVEALKKMKYWQKKHNLGIQAKVAANPRYAKSLGLEGRMDYSREHLAPDVELQVWLAILALKFQQEEFKQALLETGDLLLVERARTPGGYWNGLVRGRQVEGQNQMGHYMMTVRSAMKQRLEWENGC